MLPGSDPCAYIHYSYGINHQVLPSGAQTGIPGAASSPSISPLAMDPGYWYWSFWDEVSDITGGIVWKFHLNEDGDANGLHVYQWHVNCTPSGLGTSVTWCGYLYNGGGAPYYGMQFGLNGTICIGINPVQVCYNHGMRRWIDDNGNPSTFYYW